MKKGLLALLLAVALVAPVFAADEGAMELDIKAGFNLMSSVDLDGHDYDVDPAFTAGVDFFYYVMPQLAIGAGVSYVFNSEVDVAHGGKIGWTNLYAQGKYVFDLGDDLFNNIYPLVQVGYDMLRVDPDDGIDTEGGLYWGIGAGTTIKECVVFELLYSNGNATTKVGPGSFDSKYSTLQLKAGYKFSF
ncbi:MAG: outer membrane beta-barrel protein [Elusimicrobia bacterium]|nr:outer membrane beta-barrel protein [Elusimicrobiota bacterium]